MIFSGNIADFEDSDSERYKRESLPVIENLGSEENQTDMDPGSISVLYRAPSLPVQEENG